MTDRKTRSHQRAEIALGTTGGLNGFTEPNLGAESGAMQHRLGVSDAGLSLGWAGWAVGMLTASIVAGGIARRIGSRRLVIFGGSLYWLAFSFIGTAQSVPMLFAIMFATGLGNGGFDVGWSRLSTLHHHNRRAEEGESAGLVVQLLNGLFSLGSLLAALLSLLLAFVHVSMFWHLLTVGLGSLGLLWLCVRGLPEVPEVAEAPVAGATTTPPVTVRTRTVALVALLAGIPIGVGYFWATIELGRVGASPTVARLGLVVFTGAEALVRFTVNELSKHRDPSRPRSRVRRWFADPVILTRGGAVVAIAGLGLIAWPATLTSTLVGLGLLSGGIAPILPLIQPKLQDMLPGHEDFAAAMGTRYIYVALVLGPVIVGPLSTGLDSGQSLRYALGALVVAPMLVLVLARFLRETSPSAEHQA